MVVLCMSVCIGGVHVTIVFPGRAGATLLFHPPSTPSKSVRPLLSSPFLLLHSLPIFLVAMSFPAQTAARCCRQLVRPSAALRLSPSTYLSQRTLNRRWESTGAAAAPANPKITQIVDQISQLTLLETADLVATLKVRCLSRWWMSQISAPHSVRELLATNPQWIYTPMRDWWNEPMLMYLC